MFRDKIELKDFDKMDAEYKDLLGRVLAIQADCEIGGPHLYVKDMLPTAPTKMDQLIVARTAAEEVDHFRKVARVAGDIGVDVSHVLSWPNEKRYLEAFRGLINTWEDYAVFGFLIDRVGLYQLGEFSDCTYVALPQILPEIVKEELGHIGFGTNKTAELAAKGDEQKEKVQSAVNFWYIKARDMFGHSESKRSERFVYWASPTKPSVPKGWKFSFRDGDPKAGKTVFMNMQCYSCHAIQIPGEKLPSDAAGIGPELTGYSALPKEYLAESIIKAHTVVAAPGYAFKGGKASMGNYNHFLTIQEMIDIVAFLKHGLGKR